MLLHVIVAKIQVYNGRVAKIAAANSLQNVLQFTAVCLVSQFDMAPLINIMSSAELNVKFLSYNSVLPRLPYSQYFGGVSAVTPDQYMKMNGFPNQYWGWGGEDDDIAAR